MTVHAEGNTEWTDRLLMAVAVALGACAAAGAYLALTRQKASTSLSHLKVGRVWEYDILPGGATETTEVMEQFSLPDGQKAFRVEYRRPGSLIDAVFTSDARGQLIQLSQSNGAATFDPPLVGLGPLRIGAGWSTKSVMILPSKFRASTPTTVSGVVVGIESITVPAGTFRCFRIDQVTNGRECTSWHAPGIGMIREVTADEELVLRRLRESASRKA